jgi:hypothetical protein
MPAKKPISQAEAIKKADAFRLRMVYSQWYIWLYKDGKRVFDLGPFDYNIANVVATRSNLVDLDRLKSDA